MLSPAAQPQSRLNPALGYSLLLGSTAFVNSVLAWQQPRFLPVAAVKSLFLVSEVILAYQAFRGGFPGATEFCWATYGPGQMLIVAGMVTTAGLIAPVVQET